ncbi:putative porin [Aequorivita viscosa]|uniref:Putative porin n=1 Tax=Aequorivita viscosa TaxID=797419 RepID=A0A1M6HF85_9FLAO|nr:putative porin [Aequorivita viscosa]SDW91591.1 Putative porin [Aequorivita viscosa]SHJ20769.1 Putative porin [Aequorivita viscosa]
MKKILLLLLVSLVTATVFSQAPSSKKEKPPITDYRIISFDRDTTFVDTTLSIRKKYKFNYLRKDNFELLQFSNVGQTYNSLAYSFDRLHLKPLFAAQSHHFNYKEIEDVNYFRVPTPLTELYFKTAYEQGQQMDAFFTVNTSPQLNFSIGYKGVRSLGKYQHILTSTGNFLFTANYHTKNNRYAIRTHVAAQDIMNQENGGLNESSLALFINNDSEFRDRGRMDVLFEDADNKLEGLRFYGDHYYELISERDSTAYTVLTVGNVISFEHKDYRYNQTTAFEDFGPSYVATDLSTRTKLEDFNVKGFVDYNNSLLGKITGWAGYTDLNYGYNSVLILDNSIIPDRIIGNMVEVGAAYEKQYRGFELSGKGAVNVAGDFDGNYLQGAASYNLNDDLAAKASVTIHSVAPNFNFQLNQSDYKNYNWKTNLNNVKSQELKFEIDTKKFGNASVSYTGIDDYTYFGIKANESTPSPLQASERVDYLKIKAEKEFTYGQFALENTIMYQQVLSGENVFNVPQLITRNSLYYQNHLFKKALFLQTGVTFKYFTKYNMNAYDPVLAEFYVQNNQELGGFPLVDLFFNAKIRQTRIYFVYENFTALFSSKNEYFAAPGYPYRDNVLRFGLVWNFFL